MEPNMQNTTPIPPPTQPSAVNQPITQPAPVQPEKNNKMLFLALAMFILIGLGIGGIFFLNNRQTIPQTKIETPVVSQVSPTPISIQPTITTQPTQTPEQALQDVTIIDPSTDMTDINADLSQL